MKFNEELESENKQLKAEVERLTAKAQMDGEIALSESVIDEVIADEKIEKLKAERDEALANYQFMVNRACDEKLDGYRELGAKCASLEAEVERLKAVNKQEVERLRESLKTALIDCQKLRRKIRKYTIELKSHTWQQERAAVMKFLVDRKNKVYGLTDNALSLLDYCFTLIERGEHWPKGGKG